MHEFRPAGVRGHQGGANEHRVRPPGASGADPQIIDFPTESLIEKLATRGLSHAIEYVPSGYRHAVLGSLR